MNGSKTMTTTFAFASELVRKYKEIERLKVALKDMCELWESMGKQIPPLLNEQKYLNAKALTGKDNNVPANDTDSIVGRKGDEE